MKRLTKITSLPILPRLAASNQYGKTTKMRAKWSTKYFKSIQQCLIQYNDFLFKSQVVGFLAK